MIFVPLPLFATLALAGGAVFLVLSRDMTKRSNQLFALLPALYAVQSLLLCLRWGYGLDATAPMIAALAPVLPVCACLAYLSLTGQPGRRWLWLPGVVAGNWLVLALARDLADAAILLTYLGLGAGLLYRARAGSDAMTLARISRAQQSVRAMALTGGAMIASGLTDLFVLVDFIRSGGAHVGLAVALAQTAFLLGVGLAALVAQTAATERADTADDAPEQTSPDTTDPDDTDTEICQRLTALFEAGALHRDTDLNLRRLARRLHLPDRSVSRAINRSLNISLSQFVNTYRIRDACRLLAETDQTILQISLASGFLTKSNFNREFLRVTGQTPTQWRNDNRTAARG